MDKDGMSASDPLDENAKRRLVLKLVTKLRCVTCRQPYHPRDFALIEQRPEAWVLGIECRHCGTSAHIVVLIPPNLEPGIDLGSEEVQATDSLPPITTDDVLDVHTFLNEFDGDLDKLFV